MLLSELSPEIVRAARLIVGAGSPAAEDAAQEAMIDVLRGIGGLREPDAVRTWALRVTTTRAVKIARRERLLALASVSEPASERAVGPADGRAAALKAAFDELPVRMRAVAVLRLHVGLTEEETAGVLGCAAGTVKSQLHAARRRLSDSLRAQGFAPTAPPGRPGVAGGA
ncbi:MAG: RNA polymerase sigma factor [Gaiellaceae bacterium]